MNKHMAKDCPKPEKTSRDQSQNFKQNTSVNAIFSTNNQIPLDIWKFINDQLEALELDDQ